MMQAEEVKLLLGEMLDAAFSLSDGTLLCPGPQDASAEEHGPAGEAALPLLLLHHRFAPPASSFSSFLPSSPPLPPLPAGVIMLVGWLQGKSILDMFTIGVR